MKYSSYAKMLTLLVQALLIVTSVHGASPPPSNTAAAARANNQFGFELQNQLIKGGVKNTFFSPINIGTALAMTYLGARGETAAEMDNVLHFSYIKETNPQNSLVVHEAYKTLLDQYNSPSKSFQLFTANNIYPAKDFELLKEYTTNVDKYYKVNPVSLDYSKSAESAKVINKFVEDHTNNRIKNLFGDDAFTSDTKLVLVSAIYFKGLWKTRFNVNDTIKNYDFKLLDGKTKKVDMMRLSGKRLNYLHEDTLAIKMIELPYDGDEISMYVILPDADNGLKDDKLTKALTAEKFKELRSNLNPTELEDVKLPKFKLETKYSALQDDLKAMKLVQLFDPSLADLSGIDGRRDLVVSKIVHQAFVQVDEEGTEAAAATGIIMMIGSSMMMDPVEKPEFVADHSFVFYLHHMKTDVTLFQGIICDPPPVDQ